jgi:antirestriction protein ArdC
MKNEKTERLDVYQLITDQLIAKLEAGTIPWVHYLKTNGARGYQLPKNFVSKKPYRGINVLLLGMSEFTSPYWLTFKQCSDLGGSVRRGEHGSIICFWKQIDRSEAGHDESEEAEHNKAHFVLRYYRVWNVQQCEGLEVPEPETQAEELDDITPIERAEEIARSYFGRPDAPSFSEVAYARTASYSPASDTVTMAASKFFVSSEEYAAAKFHEMAHSVSDPRRMNIDLDKSGTAKSVYSRSELFAEMSASMLCGITGILDRTIDNSASYLAGWLSVLKADKRAVIVAAGAAQRACDYILDQDHTAQQSEPQPLPLAA